MGIGLHHDAAKKADEHSAKRISACHLALMTLIGCFYLTGSTIPASSSAEPSVLTKSKTDLFEPGVDLGQASVENDLRIQNQTTRPSDLNETNNSHRNPHYLGFAESKEQIRKKNGLFLTGMEAVSGSKEAHFQLASSRHYHYYRRGRSGGFPGYTVKKHRMNPTNKGYSASRSYGRYYGKHQYYDDYYYRGPRRGAEYFIGGIIIRDGHPSGARQHGTDGGANCKYGQYCAIDLGGPKIITLNDQGDIENGELIQPDDLILPTKPVAPTELIVPGELVEPID
jgi:hypothetical protein